MDMEEAKTKLAAYQEVLSRRHTQAVEEEFTAIERAYKELATGTPLIDPIAAIRDAGWRADARPVLAIARADLQYVRWSIPRDSRGWNPETHRLIGPYAPMTWQFLGARKTEKHWTWHKGWGKDFMVPDVLVEPPGQPQTGLAMVPLVPAEAYPARGLDLAKHFVLWEVESWDLAPPVDPMLLKPIGGSLYAVIYQWNLTEIERAIIAGTRRHDA
jgi:hypothetical protein